MQAATVHVSWQMFPTLVYPGLHAVRSSISRSSLHRKKEEGVPVAQTFWMQTATECEGALGQSVAVVQGARR